MSREFRNRLARLESKIAFVSPVPMVAALRTRQASTPTPRPRKKRPLKAYPGSIFDVRVPKKAKAGARPRKATPGARTRKAAKARYNAATTRPRTLPQARAWAKEKLVQSRTAHLNQSPRAARAERVHQAAQGVLQQWEGSRRAPKGFRRGRG